MRRGLPALVFPRVFPLGLRLALLAIFMLAAANPALACSCIDVPVRDVYAKSDFVFVGRVVGVRRITANPARNSPAEYEVTFEAIRRVKGGDPGRRTARFQHTFDGMTPADLQPPSDEKKAIEKKEFVVSSCDTRYVLDDLYLLFVKKGEPLGTIGMCSSRVRKYSWDALQEVEALRK
jgi:hypothetical protein